MDSQIQEDFPDALCNFWLSNVDSTGPLMLWDAFKAWLRGEYITKIAAKKRRSVQSLRQLEEQAQAKENLYVLTPNQNN